MSKSEEITIIKTSYTLMLAKPITEHDLCEQLFISETAFRNIFNKYFGMPPKIYMKKVQMQKAKTLLKHTDLSIACISEQMEYATSSKFSAAFKRQFKLTPSEYRKTF